MDVPATPDSDHARPDLDDWVRERARQRVARLPGDRPSFDEHLSRLDRERGAERALEGYAAAIGLVGLALAGRSRGWLLLPAAALGFLLQQAIRGGSAPMALLRRLGYRTARDVERERHAVKALRGDYAALKTGVPALGATQALEAAERR